MQALVLAMLCAATLYTYGIEVLGLPGLVKYIPELLSPIAAMIVVLAGTRQRFHLVQPKYWFAFGVLLFTIVGGIIINDAGAGTTIAGMRSYVRAIPFFFLPAVFNFKEQQIRQQLITLLILGIVQVPTAAYQRWLVWSEGRFSGDSVQGTFEESGTVSLFLICAVLVLLGLVLRNRISRLSFMVLFFVLLIPTAINETKITVIVLPLGLFVALMVGAPSGRRLKMAIWAAALLVGFGAIFIPIYNFVMKDSPYHVPVQEFFTEQETLEKYVESSKTGVGATKYVGRGDAVRIPIQYLSRDPVWLAFGLGLGNASVSALGESFSGDYSKLFDKVTVSSASVFILEIGFVGTTIVLVLYWLVFRDAVELARMDEGIFGALAIGLTGIVMVMLVSTFYKVTHVWTSLSYLYWYFAGLIAARRVSLALGHVDNTEPIQRVRGKHELIRPRLGLNAKR